MSQEEINKTVINTECPHCKKEIFIMVDTHSPNISGVYTSLNIQNNKDTIRKAVLNMNLTEDQLKEVTAWISAEDTIIMDEDVDQTIQTIKKSYEIK